MFMHDHSKQRDDEFCPIMKEICHQGWTESMGEIAGSKRRPKCKAWQPVTVVNPMATPQQTDVYDCSVFGWVPDLLVQSADEAYKGAAATEQVRNQIAESNATARLALSFFQGIAKRMRAQITFPKPPAAIENGKGGQPNEH